MPPQLAGVCRREPPPRDALYRDRHLRDGRGTGGGTVACYVVPGRLGLGRGLVGTAVHRRRQSVRCGCHCSMFDRPVDVAAYCCGCRGRGSRRTLDRRCRRVLLVTEETDRRVVQALPLSLRFVRGRSQEGVNAAKHVRALPSDWPSHLPILSGRLFSHGFCNLQIQHKYSRILIH